MRKPGQLSGLTRVRAITQDDGHLFLRVAQIKQEVGTIVSIIKEFYTTLGMVDDYWVSLSVSDPATPEKYLGSRDVWDTAESSTRRSSKTIRASLTKKSKAKQPFMAQSSTLCSRTQSVANGNLLLSN
jgi:threonyl-tRNA synthetase